MGPWCYIEYRGIRNRTIRGFYCICFMTIRGISTDDDHIAYNPAMTDAKYRSNWELTKDTLYFALMGELWGVYCEHFSALEKSNSWVELSWGSGSPVEFMGHIWWLGDHFSKVLALWEKIDHVITALHSILVNIASWPVLIPCRLDCGEQILVKYYTKYASLHSRKCITWISFYQDIWYHMVYTLGCNEHNEATELWAAVRLYKPDWLGPVIHNWPIIISKNLLKSFSLHAVVNFLFTGYVIMIYNPV